MRYPTLYSKQPSRQMVDVFKGYNHNLRISDSEFYNMKNEEEYIEGILRLTEDHDEQLGIFTVTYEDEMIMADFIVKMAA